MTSIEVLNADCLSQIFLNLNFLERVKLENVCQAWYTVLQVSHQNFKLWVFLAAVLLSRHVVSKHC